MLLAIVTLAFVVSMVSRLELLAQLELTSKTPIWLPVQPVAPLPVGRMKPAPPATLTEPESEAASSASMAPAETNVLPTLLLPLR